MGQLYFSSCNISGATDTTKLKKHTKTLTSTQLRRFSSSTTSEEGADLSKDLLNPVEKCRKLSAPCVGAAAASKDNSASTDDIPATSAAGNHDRSPKGAGLSFPPPLPPRGNLRLHPAVLRRSTTKPTLERSKALFRQSFPASGASNQGLIPTVSIEDEGPTDPDKETTQSALTLNRQPPVLHRQGAVSNENILESSDLAGHRRPRSLMHQSAGSSSAGFSLFGSVDSEQSVPRTAPLATPEQELSLLEMSSVENLPHDGAKPKPDRMEQQQSMEGLTNDVFDESALADACLKLKSRTSTVKDVNFMDLSVSSSNQESPEQSQPCETGILSSSGIGLDSPTVSNVPLTHHDASRDEKVVLTPCEHSGFKASAEGTLHSPAEDLPTPKSFNFEVTPPAGDLDTGLSNHLPDVVPQTQHRQLCHRKKSLTTEPSSSFETDSSDAVSVPLSYDASLAAASIPSQSLIRSPVPPLRSATGEQSAFLFPVDPGRDVERKDSTGSSSGFDTPEVKLHHTRQGYPILPSPVQTLSLMTDAKPKAKAETPPVIAKLPSIPERSTYRVELQPGDVLPLHWEARMDCHGRVFYIDHKNHTTTWQKPALSEDAQGRPIGSNREGNKRNRQQLDHRYQSIRKTMTNEASGPNLFSDSDNALAVAAITPDRQRELLVQGPVVQFVRRQDFCQRVLQSEHPAALLYNRSSVRHMISRVKRDPTTFERYQHNRDLVALLNIFADKDVDLPPGWEAKLDRNGKVTVF